MSKVVYPAYISLEDWAAALLFSYPNEPLPILRADAEGQIDDKTWQEWGALVAGTGIFAEQGVPAPRIIKAQELTPAYIDWVGWAKELYLVMNTINIS